MTALRQAQPYVDRRQSVDAHTARSCPAALISIYDSTGQRHEVVKANGGAAAAAGALLASVELTPTHIKTS